MCRFSRRFLRSVAAAGVLLAFDAGAGSGAATHISPRIQAIRYWSFGDVTRIAVQTPGEYKVSSNQVARPARLYFDLSGGRRLAQVQKHSAVAIHIDDERVKQIRVAEVSAGKTRIVFDLALPVRVTSSQLVNPNRVMIEIRSKNPSTKTASLTTPASSKSSETVNSGNVIPGLANRPVYVRPKPVNAATDLSRTPVPPPESTATRADSPNPGIDAAIGTEGLSRNRLLPSKAITHENSAASDGQADMARVESSSLTRRKSSKLAKATLADDSIAAAESNSSGDRSLVRVFGLKLGKVVIDAGHGGHDTGTVGPDGLLEKDLVLDVALRVGRMIQRQLGAEVVYTRTADVFIPLEDRTRIANNERADLFISIHANSSPSPGATGVETYYFNFTSDKSGLDLATRENATATSSISDLNDLLHKAVLKAKVAESRDFAQKVQSSLSVMAAKMNKGSRDRGVRRAPFVVLIGAMMPSILAEVGFVSNPHDEILMRRIDQRQRIADALFKGVAQYAATLSHVQLARAK